jgi:hypothetical protein
MNQHFQCTTCDLSHEGMALTGHRAVVPEGTFMRVNFRLPRDETPIDIDGVLVHTHGADEEMVWGLSLFDPSSIAKARIDRYLGREDAVVVLEPATPPDREARELRGQVRAPQEQSAPAESPETAEDLTSPTGGLDEELEAIYERAMKLADSALESQPKKWGHWPHLRRSKSR